MIESIEVQVISKILTTEVQSEIDTLLAYDISYFSGYRNEYEYIQNHVTRYQSVPSRFDFMAQFPDFIVVAVPEPIQYLCDKLRGYKRYLILLETFNKIKDLGEGDVDASWKYLAMQCEKAESLTETNPVNIVKDAQKRADQILEYSKQKRIPTGFAELDKALYGGLSTVEELFLVVARTNSGKAQPLWAPVLTPTGWKSMGSLKVGDIVVGKNNDNGKIVEIFPQGVKDYYRINFDDGTFAECCDEHLWPVLDSKRRERSNKHYG